MYNVEVSESDFEDFALQALDLINNRHTRLYKFVGDAVNNELTLPCNVRFIESVHIPINDAQMTSNKTIFNSIETLFIEGYIDAWNVLQDPINQRGKLVKYREADNTLYFSHPYKNVIVIYHGDILDEEDDLPMITEKEKRAIAAFVAYSYYFREGLKLRDANLNSLAQQMEVKWLKLCNSARIPEYLSQNDMDGILDAKTRWDRKTYGKSYKSIL